MRMRVNMKLKTDIVHVTFSSGSDIPHMPYGIVMMSRADAETFAHLLWEGSRQIDGKSGIGGNFDKGGAMRVDIETQDGE